MRHKWALFALVAALCVIGWSDEGQDALAADAPAGLQGAHVVMENRTEGDCNVLTPRLEGHPDASIQGEINERIAAALQTEELLRVLERVGEWGGDEDAASGIRMEGSAHLLDGALSLALSLRGELPGGELGHAYIGLNFDLFTGREIALEAIFARPEEAIAHMEALIGEETEAEGLNAYLEQADILPMPQENFSIDERGLTVYYPASQYRLISGTSGAFVFLYYQLEPFLQQSPLCEQLLERRPAPDDPAEQVRRDVAEGVLPGVPARLGMPMEEYIARYRSLAEPDYTLDGPLYLFESPLMQGVRLISPTYPEEEDVPGPVIAIRASLIDLYGLRPGTGTLLDVTGLLGEPDEITIIDEETADDMLLFPGSSYWYEAGGNRLELHADESGLLRAIILHAGE